MFPYLIWLISYVLPVTIVLVLLFSIKKARQGTILRSTIIHLGLLFSIIISQYLINRFNINFPFYPSLHSLILVTASIVISLAILGKFGLLYSLSSFLQQLCMLSISLLLLQSLPTHIVILLIAPIYSLSHILQPRNWKIKLPLTLVWGSLSILIFSRLYDLFLNISLHNIIGTILISISILYKKSEFSIKRKTY